MKETVVVDAIVVDDVDDGIHSTNLTRQIKNKHLTFQETCSTLPNLHDLEHSSNFRAVEGRCNAKANTKKNANKTLHHNNVVPKFRLHLCSRKHAPSLGSTNDSINVDPVLSPAPAISRIAMVM